MCQYWELCPQSQSWFIPLKACGFISHTERLSPFTARSTSIVLSTCEFKVSFKTVFKRESLRWFKKYGNRTGASLIFNQLGCKLDVEVHFQSWFGSRVASTHGEVHLRFEDDSALSGRARVFSPLKHYFLRNTDIWIFSWFLILALKSHLSQNLVWMWHRSR